MLNKSYSYLVPLLSEFCPVDKDYIILLDNVYALHVDYPDETMITISYEFIDNDMFMQYLELFRKNELFKEMYVDKENISITFYFPKDYLQEHLLYCQGKFSRFREEAKDCILKYILDIHKLKDAERIRRVLYKDESLRKELEKKLDLLIDPNLELSSKPNLVNEMFVRIEDMQDHTNN